MGRYRQARASCQHNVGAETTYAHLRQRAQPLPHCQHNKTFMNPGGIVKRLPARFPWLEGRRIGSRAVTSPWQDERVPKTDSQHERNTQSQRYKRLGVSPVAELRRSASSSTSGSSSSLPQLSSHLKVHHRTQPKCSPSKSSSPEPSFPLSPRPLQPPAVPALTLLH